MSAQRSSLEAGSLCWAKITGYAWWPALIDFCPDTGIFYRGTPKKSPKYHVAFFTKEPTRAWVDAKKVKLFKRNDQIKSKSKSRLYNKALKYADEALKMTNEQRLEHFGFLARWPADKSLYESTDKPKKKPKFRKAKSKKQKPKKSNARNKTAEIPKPATITKPEDTQNDSEKTDENACDTQNTEEQNNETEETSSITQKTDAPKAVESNNNTKKTEEINNSLHEHEVVMHSPENELVTSFVYELSDDDIDMRFQMPRRCLPPKKKFSLKPLILKKVFINKIYKQNELRKANENKFQRDDNPQASGNGLQ